jgi:hypothetical protein
LQRVPATLQQWNLLRTTHIDLQGTDLKTGIVPAHSLMQRHHASSSPGIYQKKQYIHELMLHLTVIFGTPSCCAWETTQDEGESSIAFARRDDSSSRP